jgi:hypothetical protein
MSNRPAQGVPAIVVIPPEQTATAVNAAPELAFEAFGVEVVVATNDAGLLDRVGPILPPGWRACAVNDAQKRFTLIADNQGTFGIAKEGKGIARGVELDLALELLGSLLRIHIGDHSPVAIFVHAGVVGHAGKALVLPGVSFAGKTTLVAELVRAGATYYSDEFALVDDDGLVHPYAKPLSVRGADLTQTDHDVATIGGTTGVEPLPVGTVVVAHYKPGAQWRPRELSAGEGVLALLANTVPAQSRPAESLRALSRAVEGVRILEGERGEARDLAPLLLAELAR